eukprot:COSAG02_NODE_493_length_21166_cov_13.181318_12_plen_118_part_00
MVAYEPVRVRTYVLVLYLRAYDVLAYPHARSYEYYSTFAYYYGTIRSTAVLLHITNYAFMLKIMLKIMLFYAYYYAFLCSNYAFFYAFMLFFMLLCSHYAFMLLCSGCVIMLFFMLA